MSRTGGDLRVGRSNPLDSGVRRWSSAATACAALGACLACNAPNATTHPPSPVGYEVGSRPRALAVADLNGDERLDVAVTNAGDGTVTLLLGTGDGALRPSKRAIPAGQEPSDIDAVDFDKDGDVDLVVANHETSRFTVLLNDGKAGFAPAPGSPFETGARPHVHGLATGDFDGDGWIDVAVDSADSKDVRVRRGGPKGPRDAVAVPVGTMPYFRLGAADVTGDGRPEILVPGHGDDTVRVLRWLGGMFVASGKPIRLTAKPWMVVGEDVSGDGRKDLVVVQSDAVSVWLGGTDGFSAAAGSPFAVAGATEVATGDIDGDGVADIAIGPWDGDQVTVIRGRQFSVRKARACARPIGLAIADLDGDGRGEILATCATRNHLLVLGDP